jgi:ubiquinone/menaquinone biosynthesis C-methylase UbiE
MTALSQTKPYWRKICGIEDFKVQYKFKELLYRCFGLTLPKQRCQRRYWDRRAVSYMDEVFDLGYHDREVFFQDMLVDSLRDLKFDSYFEAGCGFGWNIRRLKAAFPAMRGFGLDFSFTQLHANARRYLSGCDLPLVNGDNRFMPFKDKSIDVGVSLGVFMNIHPHNIRRALSEMCRVCRKRIVHLEWDETHAGEALRRQRAFKTNIISHDYAALYREMGRRVTQVRTWRDWIGSYEDFRAGVKSRDLRWEGFEGPDKYVLVVVEP